MDSKEKLLLLRRDIDKVDRQMVELFGQRMKLSEQIAHTKAQGNMAITDDTREQQVINNALALADESNKPATISFVRTLMALSKIKQTQQLMSSDSVLDFPVSAVRRSGDVTVAFQGVSGAWGDRGAERLFPEAALRQYEYFDDVFEAVGKGQADYGVLPIENSQSGAIGEVYDLLRKHSCYIIGEVWIAIAQCLLAKEGAALPDIREVFSHPEGFNQCRRFLKNKSWDLTSCRNTAYAAALAAEKGSAKYAAIGSRKAARAHGLSVLVPDIMDNPNNRTRFIAISAAPVYDEDCTSVSVTFSTAHKSGALCAVLECFMLAGINLTRIESRPASQDKYRFFADLEANILSDRVQDALKHAAVQCDYFEVLGCYPTTKE